MKASGNFSNCPIDIAIHLLSNKWTISIVQELMSGPKRPSDLEKNLKGISAKTLAERLHDLQSAHLVLRQSYPEVPPRVEYSLTELGYELKHLLQALKSFGLIWLSKKNFFDDSNQIIVNENCNLCLNENYNINCPAIDELGQKKIKNRIDLTSNQTNIEQEIS